VKICFVGSTNGNRFMTELLQAVAAELAESGAKVEWAFDRFPHFDEPMTYVVIPHEFFALVAEEDWPDREQLAHTISFCVEMPGTIWFDFTATLAQHTAAAVSINRSATAELRRRGVRTEGFQLGYTPMWDRWLGDPARERNVDLLYMGSTDERRDGYLSGYARTLWPFRSKIMLPPIAPRTSRRPDYYMGEEKLALIGSSRILINLHRGGSRSFEWLRVLECICNGCVVASEHSRDYEPLIPGDHFVSAAPESVGLLVANLLSDPDQLESIQRSAYDFVRSELPMSVSASRLGEIADDLAGRAVRSVPGGESNRFAVPQMLRGETPFQSPSNDVADELARLRAGLHRLVLDNLETRRLLQALVTAPGDDWDADGVRLVTSTLVSAEPSPRVSVLVPVFNHESEVFETLQSVVASRYQDIELLVYDDGSADRSLERVCSFAESHSWLPTAVFQSHVNRGPSHARNVLVGHARGEFVFMLDADNKIYPTTLERLVEILDETPDASFAYPMLAVHTGGVASGLISCLPWNPADLVNGNYIDTMAMLRRDALVEIGGYCEDMRLIIWEDYDLWCRFAEAGLKGVLLPEMLGWYRRTEHSRNANARVDTEAVLSFIRERSPTVFAKLS